MKFVAGAITGIIGTVIAGVANAKLRTPATDTIPPHATVAYEGLNYVCDLPSNHKSRHHAVFPKGWDPYFQDAYWG